MSTVTWSLQHKRDTAANWTANNPVLLNGQIGLEKNGAFYTQFKVGDGVTAWNSLGYFILSSGQTLNATLSAGNTTSGNNLIVTTNDEIYFGGLTKFSQGYDGSTLNLIDVASGDGLYITEGGGTTTLRGDGSAIGVDTDIDVNSAGEIFFTGTFYNFSGLSGNKVTYINNSNHLITTNVVTDNNNLFFPSNYGIDNPTPGDVLNIGGSYASTINIGRAGATVNILGAALYEYAANQYVLDKLITLNYGGAVSSGAGVGFEIEENNVITGYFKTNASRNGYELLTPAIAYKATLSLASLTADSVFTLPNIAAGTLATIDGGQTFTSAVWQATSISTTYTDAKIKGSVAASNRVAFGSGSADTLTDSAALVFNGNELLLPSTIHTKNAIAASSNAATVPVTYRHSQVTNDSAATLTITITTTSAVDGQLLMVSVLDFSAVAQTIAWVNTEDSNVAAPTASNGSTTLPLTVGFKYNSATSKWRCIASA